eukprot:904477-Rhodomonas_salina.1
MERLGYRGSLQGSLAAAQLGVTHFEASTLKESDHYVGAKELAGALEESGKELSLDWKTL